MSSYIFQVILLFIYGEYILIHTKMDQKLTKKKKKKNKSNIQKELVEGKSLIVPICFL